MTVRAPAKVLDLLPQFGHGWRSGPGDDRPGVRCTEVEGGHLVEAAVLPQGRRHAGSEYEAADIAACALAAMRTLRADLSAAAVAAARVWLADDPGSGSTGAADSRPMT